MTVYVDNAFIPALIRGYRAKWSHLTADTVEELDAFIETLGLRRSWFQAKCKAATRSVCPTRDGVCRHFHYDVVETRRDAAIRLGARAIDIREMGNLIRARKDHFDAT